jgi:AAA15 family ATPase/GTPase
MITDLTFQNFRGFSELHLKDLRQINLVVGRNGTGKTALLEGISLGTGANPGVACVESVSPPIAITALSSHA